MASERDPDEMRRRRVEERVNAALSTSGSASTASAEQHGFTSRATDRPLVAMSHVRCSPVMSPTTIAAAATMMAGAEAMANLGESSPIADAARAGNAEEVRFLLDAGVDPSAVDRLNMTALHYTAWYGRAEILSLLLLAGADHRARGMEGRTPLHFAAMIDNAECVSVLVQHGADVEAKDDFGWTPLHSAAIVNAERATRALLKAGANSAASTHDGETPLDLARSDGLRALLSRHH